MKKALLDECMRIALSKLDRHPENYKHWSFAIQDDKIVEWSTNDSGIPRLHYGYTARLENADAYGKRHSEIKCLLKARALLDFDKKWEVINIRLNRHGVPRLSKPCDCCAKLLMAFNCRNVYFTTEAGFAKLL
jgi:hypothetical protein